MGGSATQAASRLASSSRCLSRYPPSQNPPEALIEGMVTATIDFRPRPSLEDLKIIISPTSLTSDG